MAGSIELESRDGAQLTFTDSLQDSTNPEYIQLAAELQDGVRKEFKSFCLKKTKHVVITTCSLYPPKSAGTQN